MTRTEQAYCTVVGTLTTGLVLWPWLAPRHFEQVLREGASLVWFKVLFALVTVLGILALAVVDRDLTCREFPDRRQLVLAILLLALAAPGWVAYMHFFGSRPRSGSASAAESV